MKNIIYGHENTNIPFLVDNIEDLIGGDTYVLMTCIDSQDNVSDSSMVKKAMANAELEAGSYFGFLSFPPLASPKLTSGSRNVLKFNL